MLSLDALTKILGYFGSIHYRTRDSDFEQGSAQHFRMATDQPEKGEKFSVHGFYTLRTANDVNVPLSAKPAVCVGAAESVTEAKKLHRRIWNLGNVPFLIVRLPDQVRVYSGFRYDESSEAGFVVQETPSDSHGLGKLADFTADALDSARTWQTQREHLDTRFRVDTTLLENLQHLAQALNKHTAPELELRLAHALIGKFVYLRYLRDRNILDDAWLKKRNVDLELVFGPRATVNELQKVVEALEARFNGDVFHIDFGTSCPLNNSHISLVASVFAGDEIRADESQVARQLHLAFKAYDFRHIPVETLSSIYEQFLHAEQKGRSEGAYYTPEILADYLLAETNSVSAIKRGTKILDPACGSGIFLVLAYRQLIELELAAANTRVGQVKPERLKEILLQSIYGVERQRDACDVASFSLLLTLLNYVEPPTLHANETFRFPALLGKDKRIFCEDFFSPRLGLPIPRAGFDLIIGNPPWVELKPGTKGEDHARQWLQKEKAVAGNRIADAFALKAGRLLNEKGVAGLLLPATTLFNLESKNFRQSFFQEFSAVRITNLANLRENLFGKRATQPTTTLIFHKPSRGKSAKDIIHYGPLAATQIAGGYNELWILTIHGTEIRRVSQAEAISGDTVVWKLALWGTIRDSRALKQIVDLVPLTLTRFCEKRGWGKRLPREGAQLRHHNDPEKKVRCEELRGKKRFDPEEFNRTIRTGLHFTLPSNSLVKIDDEECYVRKRGGLAGLSVNKPPHLLISATWKNYLIFSEKYFAVPPRQMAISAASNPEALRALAVYLGSSVVDYFVFFNTPEWGVYSTFPHVAQRIVRLVPTPDFSESDIAVLAGAHQRLLEMEKEQLGEVLELKMDQDYEVSKQRFIDQIVFDVLKLPDHIKQLIEDFRDNRLPLDRGVPSLKRLGNLPLKNELEAYGKALQSELEKFLLGEAYPVVRLLVGRELIACELELKRSHPPIAEEVEILFSSDKPEAQEIMKRMHTALSEKFSQWIYIDRKLFISEGNTFRIFKAPRLLDWTRTQALNDADAIIAEVLSNGSSMTNGSANSS